LPAWISAASDCASAELVKACMPACRLRRSPAVTPAAPSVSDIDVSPFDTIACFEGRPHPRDGGCPQQCCNLYEQVEVGEAVVIAHDFLDDDVSDRLSGQKVCVSTISSIFDRTQSAQHGLPARQAKDLPMRPQVGVNIMRLDGNDTALTSLRLGSK